VLTARYLADSTVPAARKRAFLMAKSPDGDSHLELLLRELDLVASMSQAYAERPNALNLVSFPKRDSTHWRSASWRDSDAGYAGGRFAMDINAIWVPQALESIATILSTLESLGLDLRQGNYFASGAKASLGRYLRDPPLLQRALGRWRAAHHHFAVTLTPDRIRRDAAARLAWLPPGERTYWRSVLSAQEEPRTSLTFLALSLDSAGRPIPVVNTDPATELFLNPSLRHDNVLVLVAPFLRPYPVGLLVKGLGPLVANDAYAPRYIWERFRKDHYHGPRVVWGREVNLLLLGLANQVGVTGDPALSRALRRTLDAVNASGLQHNELWSYEIRKGKLTPVRYGTSSDVQLWNTTNLVVQYVLAKLPTLSP
jgi:hypothetical protein